MASIMASVTARFSLRSLLIALAALTMVTIVGTAGATERLYPQTEQRAPCASYDPLRQPFFGSTHLHTGLSFDASIRFVEMSAGNDPHGAYQFAQGLAPISLPGPLGEQGETDLRRPWIERPIDWGGVTDHAELFGEMGLCKNRLGRDAPGRLSLECRMINGFYYELPNNLSNAMARAFASNAFTQLTMAGLGPVSDHTRTAVCEENPRACRLAELKIWDEVRQAAETAYDRSPTCRFTSFVAYENTSTPLGTNWHRNVFFRNDQVVRRPITSIDMGVRSNPSPTRGGPAGVGVAPSYVAGVTSADDPWIDPVPAGLTITHPLPQRFWNLLDWGCQQGNDVAAGGMDRGCDFLAIPHNTNLGGGVAYVPPLYFDPFNAEDARRRERFEPLVEIYQDKGSSECRWDQRYRDSPSQMPGVDTMDEYCNFELLDTNSLSSASGVGGSGTSFNMAPDEFNRRAFVRNIWKDGLLLAEQEEFAGVNPFKMGVVASSDSHTGVMGWHPETADWPGHLGIDDVWPMSRPSSIQNSTGGHSVAWAEENSRDAIFAAMRRKETYGTSGTRIVARFFGGWDYDENLCERGYETLVQQGYERGVPMGGDLPPAPDPRATPTFAVAAIWDDFIGTPLEQVQLIKGWIDANGQAQEIVYRLAGDEGDPVTPETGIDPATCKPNTLGHERLCAVFRDPDFDPSERAFYYLRVLEKPVCRYSTHWCRERIGVDPLDLDNCASELQRLGASEDFEERQRAAHGAACCNNQFSDVMVQPVIQERAWTSPIWYEPAGA